MKIQVAQLNFEVGNFELNKKKIINCINEAKNNKINLIIFPNLSISGLRPRDLLLNRSFRKTNKLMLEEISKEINSNDISLLIGSIEEDNGKIFNSIYFLNNGSIELVNRKNNLTTEEKLYFESDNYAKIINYKDITLNAFFESDINSISNTADLNIVFEEKTFNKNNLDIYSKEKYDNFANIVIINPIGISDNLIYTGGSLIIKDRMIIKEAKRYEEDTTLYIEFNDPSYKKIERNKLVKEEEIYKVLTFALKDYCNKVGFKKVVLGLSGGIDSALTAVIATKALGKENVLGITMPSRYSSEGSYEDSFKLAKNLGIECKKEPIEPLFNCFIENMQEKIYKDLAEENLQARLRAVILMTYSNRENRLLLSTGNKSETAMGYCTLYGDTCGGLNLIADLYKTEVYELSKWINRDQELIPNEIIEKAPSAELRPGQKDQDKLPEYEVLDDIIIDYLEKNHTLEEISKKYDKNLVKNTIRSIDSMEYKRNQSTLFFSLSDKTFGFNRNFPIIQSYKH